MRQIDRLIARAGKNNELTFCECKLDDEDYSFYVKPLTAAQFVEAKKSMRKGQEMSDLEVSIKLFVLRALDANGNRQYGNEDFHLLMKLPIEDLTALAGAMNMDAEEDEGLTLDLKSSDEGTGEGRRPSGGTGRGRKAGTNADAAA